MKSLSEPSSRHLLNSVVTGLWIAVFLGVGIRVGLISRSHDVFATYAEAGRQWIASQPLYPYTRGFVYSPLVAAFFAAFSWMPLSLGSVLWRLLDAGVFVGGIFWWLKSEMNSRLQPSSYGLIFLLILPLSLGNFNNGQVNPMIIGLLMIAILAAREKRWTLSAIALGISVYLKIYPLSVGLLLVLIYPRHLVWRLALTLILMGALTFVLQQPAYVFEQYRRWFSTRAADDRRMNMDIAPRDFAMILKLFHINLRATGLLVLQMLTGAGAAAICVYGRLRNWSEERLLIGVLTLGTCWMLLFGPATEAATYAMLAPAIAIALVLSFQQNAPLSMRVLICASFSILLLGLILDSFFRFKKTPLLMSVQPMAALLFAGYSLFWLFDSARWEKSGPVSRVSWH